jgi:GNAT superfamily N-acetyltransferase
MLMERLLANSPLTARLLGNHLEFLRSHRGSVAPSGGGVAVRSEKAEFTYLIAGPAEAARSTLERQHCVHRLPWSGIDVATLEKAGFAKMHMLVYMAGPPMLAAARQPDGLEIEVVATCAALEDFTEVQCCAFLETPEDHTAWQPFLRAANFANFDNAAQTFYVVRDNDRAVSVALAVRTGATVGLYAVATRPEDRRCGLATHAMSWAISDARTHYGCDLVTLQVVADSMAERLYLDLGFQKLFAAEVFARQDIHAQRHE